jgi:hypothetical protein
MRRRGSMWIGRYVIHRAVLVALLLAGCRKADRTLAPEAPAPAGWRVPPGWKTEVIPFPLEFAPSVAHTGVEELRFPPGMFQPDDPGYWSYAFTWRLTDPARLDAAALSTELTAYFAGLVAAVDTKGAITARQTIRVDAAATGEASWQLIAQTFDAFTTGAAITLVGHARRESCGEGSLWVFVLARPDSGIRPALDTLAAEATCGQEVP